MGDVDDAETIEPEGGVLEVERRPLVGATVAEGRQRRNQVVRRNPGAPLVEKEHDAAHIYQSRRRDSPGFQSRSLMLRVPPVLGKGRDGRGSCEVGQGEPRLSRPGSSLRLDCRGDKSSGESGAIKGDAE